MSEIRKKNCFNCIYRKVYQGPDDQIGVYCKSFYSLLDFLTENELDGPPYTAFNKKAEGCSDYIHGVSHDIILWIYSLNGFGYEK